MDTCILINLHVVLSYEVSLENNSKAATYRYVPSKHHFLRICMTNIWIGTCFPEVMLNVFMCTLSAGITLIVA